MFYVSVEEKEYPEIPVSEFPAHVEAMHADSDFAFSQEFEVSVCPVKCTVLLQKRCILLQSIWKLVLHE